METTDNILHYLQSLSLILPLEVYVALGFFVEVIMVLAGALALSQNRPLWYLLWLAIFGAIIKTLGAWIIYVVADKLEDVVTTKFGKFIGVSHKDIEGVGKKINGGWRDNIILFILRVIPIFPLASISAACGVIKLNPKTYITSTFAGTFFRNLMYLYLGFMRF